LAQKIVDFAIQLAVILFAISFHESAHAYAALRFGDTTARDLGRISLNPIRHIDPFGSVLLPIMLYFLSNGRFIFGAAKPTPVDLRNTKDPRLANLVVSAAGPVSNFFLAAVGIVVLRIIRVASPQSIMDLSQNRAAAGALAPIVYMLLSFVIVNVGLAVFNLLPIPPLDGSGGPPLRHDCALRIPDPDPAHLHAVSGLDLRAVPQSRTQVDLRWLT